MLELTGLGSVLRGIGVLYWLFAIGAVALAIWKGKTKRAKLLWAGVAVVAFGFLPLKAVIEQAQRNAYAKEAWAYFKKKCETEAGEKIYKTVPGVKSVLVVKPLPPATDTDNYDQFWYGDPYSAPATSDRTMNAATRLTMSWKNRAHSGTQTGLDFVEIASDVGKGYIRIHRPEANNKLAVREAIERPVSRFGIAWDDISTPDDRKYWVAGSRLRMVDLVDNSVIAERIGYLIETGFGSTAGARRPWSSALGIGPNGRSCPYAGDATDQWFVMDVFKQDGGK